MLAELKIQNYPESFVSFTPWPWPVRPAVYLTLFYLTVIFGAVDGVQFIYFQF